MSESFSPTSACDAAAATAAARDVIGGPVELLYTCNCIKYLFVTRYSAQPNRKKRVLSIFRCIRICPRLNAHTLAHVGRQATVASISRHA